MDNFFQKLRDIQKKERNTGNLTEIEDSFYTDASNYLQELLKMVDNNPLSLEAYQLRDAQRITTEICERREFKIVGTAATNVQKSHDIFKGHRRDSELYDVIPFNTTPEEEEFYKQLVDIMVNHRENLMEKIIPQKQSNETKIGFKPNKKKVIVEQESEKEHQQQKDDLTVEKEDAVPKKSKSSKPVLDESQIAMMFGKAPDDVLFDENNNPKKLVFLERKKELASYDFHDNGKLKFVKLFNEDTKEFDKEGKYIDEDCFLGMLYDMFINDRFDDFSFLSLFEF